MGSVFRQLAVGDRMIAVGRRQWEVGLVSLERVFPTAAFLINPPDAER
jgi:hypothetical protein